MVPPSIPEEEAASMFPAGVYSKELPSGKKYLRYTPQPEAKSEQEDTKHSQAENPKSNLSQS